MPEGEEDDQFDCDEFQHWLVFLNVRLHLGVELEDAVHRDRDSNGVEDLNPDVSKGGVQACVAISTRRLCQKRNEGEQYPNQAVLENPDPHDVEPSEAAHGFSQKSSVLTSSTSLDPVERQYPIFRLLHAKVVLLLVDVGRTVCAHEGEEGGDCERFITVADDFKVDVLLVVFEG